MQQKELELEASLLSRLTACVDTFCGGELTLPEPEMKLALCCPSCSASLRAVDDATLKQMPSSDPEAPRNPVSDDASASLPG